MQLARSLSFSRRTKRAPTDPIKSDDNKADNNKSGVVSKVRSCAPRLRSLLMCHSPLFARTSPLTTPSQFLSITARPHRLLFAPRQPQQQPEQ